MLSTSVSFIHTICNMFSKTHQQTVVITGDTSQYRKLFTFFFSWLLLEFVSLFRLSFVSLLCLHSHFVYNLLTFYQQNEHFLVFFSFKNLFSQTSDKHNLSFLPVPSPHASLSYFFLPIANKVVLLEFFILSVQSQQKAQGLLFCFVCGEHCNRWCVILGFSVYCEICF